VTAGHPKAATFAAPFLATKAIAPFTETGRLVKTLASTQIPGQGDEPEPAPASPRG
jgi:hypothetical protein